jgi:hypothetical protein
MVVDQATCRHVMTMIETREHLIHVLTEAAEIEHDLLCSYLYAAFSLKREGEGGLSPEQAQVVERWRKAVLSVALEEMAHLACVNNLLIAVGGAPHFQRPNFPVAPGYHPAELVVRLTPFNEATLDHFIFLERPPTLAIPDGEGFEATGGERVVRPGHMTPSSQDYATVGELYDAIVEGLQALAARHGETALFDPDSGQIDSDLIGLPNIPRIDSLAAALGAIAHIKEEGEGSTGADVDSHFDRFCAIKAEWAQMLAADADFCPAWPAAHDPVMRKPLDETARVWIVEPAAAAHVDLANAIYGSMLGLLGHCFGGAGDPAEKKVLMLASIELMEASAAIGTALARMPADPASPGINAGMSFAVPRNVGPRPASRIARSLFLERACELAKGADRVVSGATAEKVHRRLANAIALLDGSKQPDNG